MEAGADRMKNLFVEQVRGLEERHFLVLYWVAQAEDRKVHYNITNCFDDLKSLGITRTKQNAVATVDALSTLRFIEVRDEGNRKNLYISPYGAKALETLVLQRAYQPKKSVFLEGR